jgi:hypothetical protein
MQNFPHGYFGDCPLKLFWRIKSPMKVAQLIPFVPTPEVAIGFAGHLPYAGKAATFVMTARKTSSMVGQR